MSYEHHTVFRNRPRRRLPAHRPAFTLVELMIVMGVILVLMGMLLYGLKSFSNSSKARETKATLEIATGMLHELDAKVKLGAANAPPIWFQQTVLTSPTTFTLVDAASVLALDPDIDFWHMPGKFNIAGINRPAPIRWPDNPPVMASDLNLSTQLQLAPYAMKNTALCMSRLEGALANRQKIEGMPPQRILRPSDDPFTNNNPSSPQVIIDESKYPLLLDGWGNPIIFVPASGLWVKMLNGHDRIDPSYTDQDFVVVSPEGKVQGNLAAGVTPAVIQVGRPFFASAGPDGDFSKGDDNIYSFEQQ